MNAFVLLLLTISVVVSDYDVFQSVVFQLEFSGETSGLNVELQDLFALWGSNVKAHDICQKISGVFKNASRVLRQTFEACSQESYGQSANESTILKLYFKMFGLEIPWKNTNWRKALSRNLEEILLHKLTTSKTLKRLFRVSALKKMTSFLKYKLGVVANFSSYNQSTSEELLSILSNELQIYWMPRSSPVQPDIIQFHDIDAYYYPWNFVYYDLYFDTEKLRETLPNDALEYVINLDVTPELPKKSELQLKINYLSSELINQAKAIYFYQFSSWTDVCLQILVTSWNCDLFVDAI